MTTATSMTCIEISEPGGPDVLKPNTRPVPEARPGEVLIKIVAAGINRPDCVQRAGLYPAPKGASDLPGLEAAGEIVALGEGVTSWAVGDKVCGLLNGGGYAQYVTTPADQCLPVPTGFSMLEAAALPETFFTVWSNVFQRAALQPGESLLIHGGGGGIGTTAIQIANKLGSRVMITEGDDDKCQACLDLGAEKAINFNKDDFVDPAREFGGGRGVNVILDIVGGDYIAKNIKALAPDGRLVNIAYLKGSKVELNFMPIMLKRLTLTGSTLRSQSDSAKAAIAAALKQHVWPLLNAGEIKPLIHSTFPLEKANEAHTLMEGFGHTGKIMLEV